MWMGLKNDSLDDQRRYGRIGYEMGFEGKSIAEAIEYTKRMNP